MYMKECQHQLGSSHGQEDLPHSTTGTFFNFFKSSLRTCGPLEDYGTPAANAGRIQGVGQWITRPTVYLYGERTCEKWEGN